jgi:hypothetical protein
MADFSPEAPADIKSESGADMPRNPQASRTRPAAAAAIAALGLMLGPAPSQAQQRPGGPAPVALRCPVCDPRGYCNTWAYLIDLRRGTADGNPAEVTAGRVAFAEMGGTRVAIDRATLAVRVEVPFPAGAAVYTGTCAAAPPAPGGPSRPPERRR